MNALLRKLVQSVDSSIDVVKGSVNSPLGRIAAESSLEPRDKPIAVVRDAYRMALPIGIDVLLGLCGEDNIGYRFEYSSAG